MNLDSLEIDKTEISKDKPPESCVVVIFGATGDLTHRELIPSLFSLACKNLIPANFAIIGFARRNWDDLKFRYEMRTATMEVSDCSDDDWKKFSKNLFYIQGNFDDPATTSYEKLKNKIKELQKAGNIADNVLFHLATPPNFYTDIIQRLGEANLAKSDTGWRRVIIEKPFGKNERSAIDLDVHINLVFSEQQIFRVDHYLGKETVQNMMVFRFANPGFEPIWNRNYIDNIQITVAEEVGVGTRGNFYEKVGVLRDMVQNHLLQLLCMAAIEPPVNYDAGSLRTETMKVLKSICNIDLEKDCILGQYGSGQIKGEIVPGYREEKNVDKESTTPTYAALKIMVDNWRWAGVPFYLRTGKRLKEKLTEVTIQFKATPHLMFPVNKEEGLKRSILTFRLQPDEGIIYTFMAKQPGAELKLQDVNLRFQYDTAFGISKPPSAYQWLLFDAMKGDQTLFPSTDWIHTAWSLLDPIIKKWESDPWLKIPNYDAGSWGPLATVELLKNNGHRWNV